MKEIRVNNNLNIVTFIELVNGLVAGYFDDDGNYQPHFGLINDIRLFYNLCVSGTDEENELPEIISELSDIEKIMNDDFFIETFNKVKNQNDIERLNFSTAYKKAQDIIGAKKGSSQRFFDLLRKNVSEIKKSIVPLLTSENLEIANNLIEKFSNGEITPQSILEVIPDSGVWNKEESE